MNDPLSRWVSSKTTVTLAMPPKSNYNFDYAIEVLDILTRVESSLTALQRKYCLMDPSLPNRDVEIKAADKLEFANIRYAHETIFRISSNILRF